MNTRAARSFDRAFDADLAARRLLLAAIVACLAPAIYLRWCWLVILAARKPQRPSAVPLASHAAGEVHPPCALCGHARWYHDRDKGCRYCYCDSYQAPPIDAAPAMLSPPSVEMVSEPHAPLLAHVWPACYCGHDGGDHANGGGCYLCSCRRYDHAAIPREWTACEREALGQLGTPAASPLPDEGLPPWGRDWPLTLLDPDAELLASHKACSARCCVECGKPLGGSWAEYEDGRICLECDARHNPLPSEGRRPPVMPGAEQVMAKPINVGNRVVAYHLPERQSEQLYVREGRRYRLATPGDTGPYFRRDHRRHYHEVTQ